MINTEKFPYVYISPHQLIPFNSWLILRGWNKNSRGERDAMQVYTKASPQIGDSSTDLIYIYDTGRISIYCSDPTIVKTIHLWAERIAE